MSEWAKVFAIPTSLFSFNFDSIPGTYMIDRENRLSKEESTHTLLKFSSE